MLKHLTRGAVVALLTFALGAPAAAQTTDGGTSSSIVAADSPLFFLQRAIDALQEVLARTDSEKATVHVTIARNRLIEAQAMLKAGKADLAAELAKEAADRSEKAAEKVAKAKAKADAAKARAEAKQARADEKKQARGNDRDEDDMEKVVARLKDNDKKHATGLERALENVTNPRAVQAIKAAMLRQQTGLKRAVEAVEGAQERKDGEGRGRQDGERRQDGEAPKGPPAMVPAGDKADPPGNRPGQGRPAGAPGRP